MTWELPPALGRRYAAVSGDRNPIHLSALGAKAFGFPRAIVHGMWTMARCVAALDHRLPDSFTVQASFRAPILLPATVAFGHTDTDEGIRFSVSGPHGQRNHLEGLVEFPAEQLPGAGEAT